MSYRDPLLPNYVFRPSGRDEMAVTVKRGYDPLLRIELDIDQPLTLTKGRRRLEGTITSIRMDRLARKARITLSTG